MALPKNMYHADVLRFRGPQPLAHIRLPTIVFPARHNTVPVALNTTYLLTRCLVRDKTLRDPGVPCAPYLARFQLRPQSLRRTCRTVK